MIQNGQSERRVARQCQVQQLFQISDLFLCAAGYWPLSIPTGPF
jgi:hypothetical protein